MPTYEYVCSSCGNAWEEMQKITEPPVELCPACKQATAKRQISGGNFILKGGGWYADLYSSSKGSNSKPEDTSASKSEGKSEGGGDAKAGAGKGEAKSEKGEAKAEPKKESAPAASTTSGGSGSSSPSKAAD
jgi:putative FmdB family regulatory protein